MEEIWKDIEGYEGLYQVSNLGRVRSIERKNLIGKTIPSKVLKPHKNLVSSYLTVNLYKNGKSQTITIHRLVAQAFIPNTERLPQVGHKDESRNNNCADNLEWTNNLNNSNMPIRKTRLSNSLKNNYISQQTRDKISQKAKLHKGRKFICDGIYFESLFDLSQYLNIPPTTLAHYANGDRSIPINLPRFMELTQRKENNND